MFQDGRKPLVIARASNVDAAKFWTSIPEGRQKEANEVGSLIETYLNKIQDSGFKVSGPTCNPNPES